MKTITKQLKTVTFCIILLLSINLNAQKEAKRHDPFVRVYSLEGKKIAKGHITFINDSLLRLKNGDKLIELNIEDIGHVKTKKSGGHNVLAATAAGATLGIVLGVSTAEPDALVLGYTASEGAVAFGGLGAIGGAAIGGIASAFKNSETYIIDGDIKKWRIFKEMIEKNRFR